MRVGEGKRDRQNEKREKNIKRETKNEIWKKKSWKSKREILENKKGSVKTNKNKDKSFVS